MRAVPEDERGDDGRWVQASQSYEDQCYNQYGCVGGEQVFTADNEAPITDNGGDALRNDESGAAVHRVVMACVDEKHAADQ